eukprot:GFUD01058778.1.p1 GENE.GFUD01058778.1~~GFUD01058778.1.p1  ORF type:complete len:364 (+),score=114.15 GFUD01058778.1:72-1163(+)
MSSNDLRDADNGHLVATLQDSLSKLPASMVCFSNSLRHLFNESKVTGQDDATKKFLEVRDNTRQNAVVYTEKLLPLSEKVVRSIGYFADYFEDLEFEDWSECLDDLIDDVEKAEGFCDLLKHMHNTMITNLKANEDKAKVGIEMLEKMSLQYERDSQDLKSKALERTDSAETTRTWGNIFAPLTMGISKAVCDSIARQGDIVAKESTALATAKKENADIAQEAVALTSTYLIPAVKDFVAGLEVCSMFLNVTKERLTKMKNKGSKGTKKPYYLMMKKQSTEINRNCMKFLSITDMMRTDLQSIPSNVSDKNYVDTWLDQQLEEFRKQHHDASFLETSKKWFKSIRMGSGKKPSPSNQSLGQTF